jgi:GNAT superfamily N-acetyltransferase
VPGLEMCRGPSPPRARARGWKDPGQASVFRCMEQSCPTSDALTGDVLALAGGTRVALRPIGAGDGDGLAALFARLSPQSRQRRFMSPKRELTRRELTFLTDIDHVRHEAVAAIDPRDGSIVGVARYVRHSNRESAADVAVAVADELHNLGIGTALVKRVVERACANGFVLLTATTLWENRPARALLRGLGFHARASRGAEIELELALAPGSARRADRDGPGAP